MKTQAEEITLAFSFRLDIFWLVPSRLLLVNINEGSARGKMGIREKGSLAFFSPPSQHPSPFCHFSLWCLGKRDDWGRVRMLLVSLRVK